MREIRLLLSLVWLTACGGSPPATDDAGSDSGSIGDGGSADAGTTDAGSFDAGSDAGFEPPVFRNPVGTPDAELARQALVLLGAGSGTSCASAGCHDITRQGIRYWRALTDTSLASCLTDLEVTSQASALAMVTCLRGGSPEGQFQATHLGVITIAAYLPWFQYVFQLAYGAGWQTEYDLFVERVGMSPATAGPALTQAEWDIVIEWFLRGVPSADDLLPNDPPPSVCTPGISADVSAHVAEMALSGWAATNRADPPILMHGCAGAPTVRDCLSSYPLTSSTTFGAEWDVISGTQMRLLYTTDYASAYWTRSSADGRFVSHGSETTGDRARIVDLERSVAIPARASYDPGFFPDNSGFMLQGATARFCEQRVLTTGTPTRIDFMEPGCTSNSVVALYQHLGASLGGGDYWTVHGSYQSDNGGQGATLNDPAASFGSTSATRFTSLINTGSGFMPRTPVVVPTPYEADAVISPSARLLITRVSGPMGRQLGFVVRRIVATPSGTTYDIELPEIARYCFNGGKPAFSYDERWLVLHHYIGDEDATELGFTGPTDPGFAAYRTQGAANIYLVDIATGERTRITDMQPGQYALFPHFRSDGWMYWMVRTAGATPEHIVASDAALVLGG